MCRPLTTKVDYMSGIHIDCGNTSLYIINVYLSYCCDDNTIAYLQGLGKLNSFCNSLDCPNILIIGDYNACESNDFGNILTSFCNENGFICQTSSGCSALHSLM